MYKIVTFRSRQLKYTDYIYDGESFELDEKAMSPLLEEDEELDRKLTRKERKAQKRKIKEAKKKAKRKDSANDEYGDNVKIYIINGEEVAVDDLTAAERAMIRADEELNKDGFYDGLEPFDNDETETFVKAKHGKLFILLVAIAITAVGYSFYQLASGGVSF